MSQLCCSRNLWIQPNCQLQALYLQVLQHQMAYLLLHLAFVEGWGEVDVLCLIDGIHLAIHPLSVVILYMFHQRLDILHINDVLSTSWASVSIPVKVVYAYDICMDDAKDGRGNFEPSPGCGLQRGTEMFYICADGKCHRMLRASFAIKAGLFLSFLAGAGCRVPSFSLFLTWLRNESIILPKCTISPFRIREEIEEKVSFLPVFVECYLIDQVLF